MARPYSSAHWIRSSKNEHLLFPKRFIPKQERVPTSPIPKKTMRGVSNHDFTAAKRFFQVCSNRSGMKSQQRVTSIMLLTCCQHRFHCGIIHIRHNQAGYPSLTLARIIANSRSSLNSSVNRWVCVSIRVVIHTINYGSLIDRQMYGKIFFHFIFYRRLYLINLNPSRIIFINLASVQLSCAISHLIIYSSNSRDLLLRHTPCSRSIQPSNSSTHHFPSQPNLKAVISI